MKRTILVLISAVVLLAGCAYPNNLPVADAAQANQASMEDSSNQQMGSNPPTPTVPAADAPGDDNKSADADAVKELEMPTAEPAVVLNPLSGLPAAHPENLLLPPALVSVTNFPPTSRPQAGLSSSPIVFELYIGDGLTRFLALFYGDYPSSNMMPYAGEGQDDWSEGITEPVIGPIRSGRILYEHIRKLYNGFIVMASAYSKVAEQLIDFVNVFGDDFQDVNSATISADDLLAFAQGSGKTLGESALSGMVFDEAPPQGGADAHSIWVYYAYKNQVFWRYNDQDGSYHRWQDNADGETFIEQSDRLTGEPLSFENVIVLLVDHHVDQKYYIDLDLLYQKRERALLFRDGKVQEIYWTTRSEEYEQTTGKLRPIRFIDADGNPIPLKPGQTWIELMPTFSPIWETIDSEKYHVLVNGRSKGSGYWAVWYKVDN